MKIKKMKFDNILQILNNIYSVIFIVIKKKIYIVL